MAPRSRSWGFPRWQGYESGQDTTVKKMCDRNACDRPGDYKAPKSPGQLDEYYWFCQEHAEEYNRGWDYFRNRNKEQIDEELHENQWHGRQSRWDTVSNSDQESAAQDAMAVLGLDEGDGAQELKRAYKEKVKEHHPDRGGDPDKFRAVTAAYSLLLDRLAHN